MPPVRRRLRELLALSLVTVSSCSLPHSFIRGSNDLPAFTKMIVAASNFMVSYWWIMLFAGAGSIFGFIFFYKRSPPFQHFLDRVILKVPVLNAWCGVPMRAAAATSALMIGVTAVSSVPIQYARGYVHPPLAAAAVLGVLAGSRAGFWFGGRARAKWLKLLMAGVLGVVSILYLLKV